jgi:hypothetical protein
MLKGLLGHSEHNRQPPIDGVDYAQSHLRSGVPVVGAHGAALVLPAATCGLVPHQLVDDPGGDAGVFQPGREGVAEVMGAVQVDRLQQGMVSGLPVIRQEVDGLEPTTQMSPGLDRPCCAQPGW